MIWLEAKITNNKMLHEVYIYDKDGGLRGVIDCTEPPICKLVQNGQFQIKMRSGSCFHDMWVDKYEVIG